MEETLITMHISPHCWGLPWAFEKASEVGQLTPLEISGSEIEERCRRNTYEWLMRQFDEQVDAFRGHYDPRNRHFSDPQTANLIAPWQLLAAFDRYQDQRLLEVATQSTNWIRDNLVDAHPMSVVLGGVHDDANPTQLWTKYTADHVVANLGIYERTGDEEYLTHATQGGKFLLQAQRHDFAPIYDHRWQTWLENGWQSFGRVAGAMLGLWDKTEDQQWLNWAVDWGEFGVSLQAKNGCFHLINGHYYSSDLAADEIRALACLSRTAGSDEFLKAAVGFADWHVQSQRGNGSWFLTIDRYGDTVANYVGPGDVANLAIAMLLMHDLTGDLKYLLTAVRAMKYVLSKQAIPGEDYPYSDDSNMAWGFWSWDPFYDHSMSPDQSTHNVRALWFFLDYYLSLPKQTRDELATALAQAEER